MNALTFFIVIIIGFALVMITISAFILSIAYIKYLIEKNRVLKKDEAIKYINRMISEEYSLKTVKSGLILEEMIYHFDNGCNTKESLKKVYPLVINKIVYFGRKARK